MGYTGRLADKLKAQDLRKKGLSYNEILLSVKVSKDTLSRWCRDIELTSEQKLRLMRNKINGQKRGSIVAAENKRNLRIQIKQNIFESSRKSLGDVTIRDRFIAGVALYFGEGDKGDGRGAVANSDPRIISFMMGWLREFPQVPEERFRGAIWIHEDSDQGAAVDFWSRLTGIPYNRFHKTYVVKNKLDSKKVRKKIHPYGVFSIRFSDTAIHRQIMGWISALFGDRILLTSCLENGEN